MLFVRRGGLNFLRNREFLAVPEGNLRMLVSWCFLNLAVLKAERKTMVGTIEFKQKKGDCKLGCCCSLFDVQFVPVVCFVGVCVFDFNPQTHDTKSRGWKGKCKMPQFFEFLNP